MGFSGVIAETDAHQIWDTVNNPALNVLNASIFCDFIAANRDILQQQPSFEVR